MSRPPVLMLRSGAVLSIESPPPDVARIVETELFYHRIVMPKSTGRGRPKGGRVPLPVNCYQWIRDPDDKFPPKIIAGGGYARRLVRVFREKGYQVLIKDMRPHPRPEIYQPMWDRASDIEWKWMQPEIIKLLTSVRYGQIAVPPGYGKTFLIGMLVDLLPYAKFAITTHSVDVLATIYDTVSRRVPNVGLVSGSKRRPGQRVTCYSGKSLHHCEEPVDILLVDEVHEFGTDDYFKKMTTRAFHMARHWGVSASAGDRTDKADFELEGVFGEVLLRLSYDKCVANECVVPIEVHWRPVVMDKDPVEHKKNPTTVLRHGIWRNKYRNQCIAEDAKSFNDDEQVLITVQTFEHAVYLRQFLPEFTLCYSENPHRDDDGSTSYDYFVMMGMLPENEPVMTRERREMLRKQFEEGTLKKVIATSVWNRGVDFRRLAVLIRADAGSGAVNDLQIPGRTSRLCDETGKRVGVVIDYEDQFNKRFRNKALARRRNYSETGWRQVKFAGSIASSAVQRVYK